MKQLKLKAFKGGWMQGQKPWDMADPKSLKTHRYIFAGTSRQEWLRRCILCEEPAKNIDLRDLNASNYN
jgi:hypothetical protein